MREIRPSGSMSGKWKRSMVWLVRHWQTKGPAMDRLHLNHRATSRLYPTHNSPALCRPVRPFPALEAPDNQTSSSLPPLLTPNFCLLTSNSQLLLQHPSTNFNIEAKRVVLLASSRLDRKPYLPCTCRRAPRRIQTKHPQGRFASMPQSSSGDRLPQCPRPPHGPPGGERWAPTSTRTSLYVRSYGRAPSAKPLVPLHLLPRPLTHGLQHCVYCCASTGGVPNSRLSTSKCFTGWKVGQPDVAHPFGQAWVRDNEIH